MARDRQPDIKKKDEPWIRSKSSRSKQKIKRNIRPNASKKLTEYGLQLREKQKVRFVYGVKKTIL